MGRVTYKTTAGPGQDRDELDIFGEQNIRTEASLSSFVKPLREGGTGGSCLLVFFQMNHLVDSNATNPKVSIGVPGLSTSASKISIVP